MIEKKTIIDQIEVRPETGHIQIRFGVLLIEDGVEIDRKWHRTMIEPGVDPDAQVAAVNADLRAMGKAEVAKETMPTLKSIAGVVHTPDVVRAHATRHLAQVAAVSERLKAAGAK